MRAILNALVDTLSPPHCCICALPLRGGEAHACAECVALIDPDAADPVDPGPLRGATSVAAYRGPIRDAVRALKFEGQTWRAAPMGAIAAPRLPTSVGAAVVVPIPSSPERLRERGYNPAGLLARAVAREVGLPVAWDALYRRDGGARQADRSLRDRALIASAWRPGRARAIRGRDVILVDDVVTSGETIRSAAAVLLALGGRSVWALCFAATPAAIPTASTRADSAS
jgi:predicted amidophosphoribosyltransferase